MSDHLKLQMNKEDHFFAQQAKELGPLPIDQGRICRIARGQLVNVIGIGPLQEGRGVEGGIWGLFGHDQSFRNGGQGRAPLKKV